MGSEFRRHEAGVLDALAAMVPEAFDGDVWRVTSAGRDPLRPSTAGGRWSPANEFEVLYTSLERDGAITEIGYRLSLEPVWPSRVRHDAHRIGAVTRRSLRFADVGGLVPLGVDAVRYASFDYGATQAVAAAARFLEYDGLIVPSARSRASHLVLFVGFDELTLRETTAVDWPGWRVATRGTRLSEGGLQGQPGQPSLSVP